MVRSTSNASRNCLNWTKIGSLKPKDTALTLGRPSLPPKYFFIFKSIIGIPWCQSREQGQTVRRHLSGRPLLPNWVQAGQDALQYLLRESLPRRNGRVQGRRKLWPDHPIAQRDLIKRVFLEPLGSSRWPNIGNRRLQSLLLLEEQARRKRTDHSALGRDHPSWCDEGFRFETVQRYESV